MAGIILTILKVIGIILLVLVGLVLFGVAAVLVCPVKYHVRASKEADKIKLHIWGSYFFRLLRFSGSYESGKDMVYWLKFLFLTLYPKKEKPPNSKKKPARKHRKTRQEKKPSESGLEHVQQEKSLADSKTKKMQEHVTEERTDGDKEQRHPEDAKKTTKEDLKDYTKTQESVTIIQKIQAKGKEMNEKIENLCKSIKNICSNGKAFRDFITSQETKEALRFLNEQRKYIFRKLKPSKLSVSLRYGFDDPAFTGEILAVFSCIYPFLWGDILVEPDFEESCLEGKAELKGKVQLYGFLLAAWRCYRHETIRKIIEKVM